MPVISAWSYAGATSTMSAPTSESPLVARSVPIDDPGELVALLPRDAPVSWVHRGDGLVGWGEVARYDVSGPSRFADAERSTAQHAQHQTQ